MRRFVFFQRIVLFFFCFVRFEEAAQHFGKRQRRPRPMQRRTTVSSEAPREISEEGNQGRNQPRDDAAVSVPVQAMRRESENERGQSDTLGSERAQTTREESKHEKGERDAAAAEVSLGVRGASDHGEVRQSVAVSSVVTRTTREESEQHKKECDSVYSELAKGTKRENERERK